MPEPRIPRADFDALVKRSGLPVDEDKKGTLYAAFGVLEEMARRVRAGGERPRESEPAHVFRARE